MRRRFTILCLCLAFLLVGLWVGRRSPRPWLDGLVYGGLATLVAGVCLAIATPMGWLSWPAALFLALPQGVLGAWLGARTLRTKRKLDTDYTDEHGSRN